MIHICPHCDNRGGDKCPYNAQPGEVIVRCGAFSNHILRSEAGIAICVGDLDIRNDGSLDLLYMSASEMLHIIEHDEVIS